MTYAETYSVETATGTFTVQSLDAARTVAWAAAGWSADAPDVPGGIHDLRRGHSGFTAAGGGEIHCADGTTITVRPS